MRTNLALLLGAALLTVPCAGEIVTLGPQSAVEVLVSATNDFLGIGQITIAGVVHTMAENPMQIDIAGRDDQYDLWHKPKLIAYVSRKLRDIQTTPNGVTVVVDLHHSDGSVDELRIVFEAVEQQFYENTALGLKYHFTWSSEKRVAHQIRETSWWRYGDSVAGLRFISQNSGYGRNSVDIVITDPMPLGGYKLAGVVETSDIGRIINEQSNNPFTFAYLPQKEARETRQGDRGLSDVFLRRRAWSFLLTLRGRADHELLRV